MINHDFVGQMRKEVASHGYRPVESFKSFKCIQTRLISERVRKIWLQQAYAFYFRTI